MLLQVANPPLVGVLGGVLVGATPLGRLLYRPDSAAAVAHTLRLPIELRVCLGNHQIAPVLICFTTMYLHAGVPLSLKEFPTMLPHLASN